MAEVLLDSNFIISCLKKKIYFEEEIGKVISGAEIVVPEQIVRELENLSNRKEEKLVDREIALLALNFIKKFRRVNSKSNLTTRYADKAILEYCRENQKKIAAVATLDSELRKLLKKELGVRAIYIRGRKGLEIN